MPTIRVHTPLFARKDEQGLFHTAGAEGDITFDGSIATFLDEWHARGFVVDPGGAILVWPPAHVSIISEDSA